LQNAERKTADSQSAIREARGEIFREHENMRRHWLDEQAVQVRETKVASGRLIAEARAQIGEEAASARESLRETSATLADRIASTILERIAR
ncbi:MAG: hypothetical protein ACREH9_01535, partial [Pseudomonadota bacterium]